MQNNGFFNRQTSGIEFSNFNKKPGVNMLDGSEGSSQSSNMSHKQLPYQQNHYQSEQKSFLPHFTPPKPTIYNPKKSIIQKQVLNMKKETDNDLDYETNENYNKYSSLNKTATESRHDSLVANTQNSINSNFYEDGGDENDYNDDDDCYDDYDDESCNNSSQFYAKHSNGFSRSSSVSAKQDDRSECDEPGGSKEKRLKSELMCVVCNAPANGYNFDAISCESCKAFFRRNAFRHIVSLFHLNLILISHLWSRTIQLQLL